MWVRGHWRSLKVVTFVSLGTVSYSPSIVTMAVSLAISAIFIVKVWRDLEKQVRGCSKSLKMAPFDRPLCDFILVGHCKYSSILYHFPVFLTLNNIVTLKSGLEVTQCHWNWCHSKAWCGFLFAFYSNSGRICIAVCEIFSVKEWRDLENQVRGCSRSLKMAPFDMRLSIGRPL